MGSRAVSPGRAAAGYAQQQFSGDGADFTELNIEIIRNTLYKVLLALRTPPSTIDTGWAGVAAPI